MRLTDTELYKNKLDDFFQYIQTGLETMYRGTDHATQVFVLYDDMCLDYDSVISVGYLSEDKKLMNDLLFIAFNSKNMTDELKSIVERHAIYDTKGYAPSGLLRYYGDAMPVVLSLGIDIRMYICNRTNFIRLGNFDENIIWKSMCSSIEKREVFINGWKNLLDL